jgi:HlyD family secretion protein
MRRFLLISAVLLIGLAIGGYVVFNGERKVPVRYRTAAVERGPVVSIVTATGSINPVVSVQVGTQVSGMIKSLHADFNSIVKAGDIVAIIDPEPFRARRDQAASNLDMAKAKRGQGQKRAGATPARTEPGEVSCGAAIRLAERS